MPLIQFPKKRKKPTYQDIAPDEIFLDSENLPEYDTFQFQGRIEQPITDRSIKMVWYLFMIVGVIFMGRLSFLQVVEGEEYAERSDNNHLRHSVVFAQRGIITDRNGVELVWNLPNPEDDFPERQYTDKEGFAHVLGYASKPKKDTSGVYYQEDFIGTLGVEEGLNMLLSGSNGKKITETDALSETVSESTIDAPVNGETVTLTIDARIQEALYRTIKETAEQVGFQGGAGVIMDLERGELISLVSYPEFSSGAFAQGNDGDLISASLSGPRNPFLNRATNGLYTPGSIVKPFFVLGALNEGVISDTKQILSTGSITIPNPYNPSAPSIFTDWTAHGLVDARRALEVSSNVYMYAITGGYKDQKGIGIDKISLYADAFGIGSPTGIVGLTEEEGTIPNPAWKEKMFDGEPWRLGDTYNTAIGQYGFQVTLLQMVRALGAIATGGNMVTPKIYREATTDIDDTGLSISQDTYQIIREGMRQAALQGTARGLNLPHVEIAAKTGTAELGVSKGRVNSWVIGFWPYEDPKYAFGVVMESGLRGNLIGGVAVMNKFFWWMTENTPEYVRFDE